MSAASLATLRVLVFWYENLTIPYTFHPGVIYRNFSPLGHFPKNLSPSRENGNNRFHPNFRTYPQILPEAQEPPGENRKEVGIRPHEMKLQETST